MGGRGSKPKAPIKVPVASYDNHFILREGCMALTRDDYEEGQLTACPFLVVPLKGKTLHEVLRWSKLCIAALGNNSFAQFQQVLAMHINSFQGDDISIGMMNRKGGTLNIGDPQLRGKVQEHIQSVIDEYDPKKDFTQRLRDLLRILNLLQYDNMYMSMFPPSTQGDDILPTSIAGKRMYQMSSDGINMTSFKTAPQLPGLSANSTLNGMRPPYKFLGPSYLLVANRQSKRPFIEAYMYFPSMTKDALPAPNYDFLGKSHRWMYRFINDAFFVTSGERCEHVCYGTPPPFAPRQPSNTNKTSKNISKRIISRVVTQAKRRKTQPPPSPASFVACGCSSQSDDKACGKLQKREIKNKNGKIVNTSQPFVNSYVVYRVNLKHPSCRPFFASDSPSHLTLNIMPTEWDIYPGCKYSIMSNNRTFFTRLESFDKPVPGSYQRGSKRFGRKRRPGTQLYTPSGKFGVYLNRGEDILSLCKKRKQPMQMRPIIYVEHKGYPRRLTIEDGVWNLYFTADLEGNDAEVSVWSMRIAKQGSAEPVALVLLDNGRIDVFDRNNISVISEEFNAYQDEQWRQYYESGGSRDIGTSGSTRRVSTDEVTYRGSTDETYDTQVEYARRLLHLKDWLRARNLLFENVSQYVDLSSMTARRAMKGDSSKFMYYDETEDYRARYGELKEFLRANGYPIT